MRAARWVNGNGELLDQVAGATSSEGLAVSADGNVVGGSVVIAGRMDGFIWTQSGGMQLIGTATVGLSDSSVQDLSANGRIAVGAGIVEGRNHGFYWSKSRGVTLAEDLLTDFGVSLGGYSIQWINAVSDDGLTFVGGAISPSGRLEPYIARIPEPASLSMLAIGVVVIASLSRRKRHFGKRAMNRAE